MRTIALFWCTDWVSELDRAQGQGKAQLPPPSHEKKGRSGCRFLHFAAGRGSERRVGPKMARVERTPCSRLCSSLGARLGGRKGANGTRMGENADFSLFYTPATRTVAPLPATPSTPPPSLVLPFITLREFLVVAILLLDLFIIARRLLRTVLGNVRNGSNNDARQRRDGGGLATSRALDRVGDRGVELLELGKTKRGRKDVGFGERRTGEEVSMERGRKEGKVQLQVVRGRPREPDA